MFPRSILMNQLGKIVKPSSFLNRSFPTRCITFMIDRGDDDDGGREFKRGFNELIQMSEEMGGDEHINMRKTAVKRKVWRYNLTRGKAGRDAKRKVYGLLDFIEYKRANKYR